MSDHDLKEHLSQYGDWLQRSYDLDLGPASDATGSIDPDATPGRRCVSQLAVAVVVAAIALVGAAVVFRDDPSGFVVVDASQDPAGPLYVLPEPLMTETLQGGQVVEAIEPGVGFGSEIVVVGRPSGDGTYNDLATIWIGAPAPQLDPEPESLNLSSGPALVWDDIFTLVLQDRDGTTIRVMADSDRVDYASMILDHLSIDESGSATIETDSVIEVIEAATFNDGTDYTSTYFEVDSERTIDGEGIVVETATSPSPLLGAGALGGELSATRIQGAHGWKLTRLDAEGKWNGIAWQASPSHIVAVSGHAPIDAIQELAESLTIVSEGDWKAALPDHTTG